MILNSLMKLTGSTENWGLYRALRATGSAVVRFMDMSFTTPASCLFKYIRTLKNVMCTNSHTPWDDDNTYCLRQDFQEQVLRQRLTSRRFMESALRNHFCKRVRDAGSYCILSIGMLELNPSYRTRVQKVRWGQYLMGTVWTYSRKTSAELENAAAIILWLGY